MPGLLAAFVMENLASSGKLWQMIVTASIAVNQLFCLSGCVVYAAQSIPVVLGLQSEESYLVDNAPFYAVWQYVNQTLPMDSKLLVFPRHTYYLEREYFRASFDFQALVDYPRLNSSDQLLARIRELGFTHVIWDDWYGRESDQYLTAVTGMERQVEQQLQELEDQGDLVSILRTSIHPLRSRLLGQGQDVEVLVYEIQ
jgi:hypothetical protein